MNNKNILKIDNTKKKGEVININKYKMYIGGNGSRINPWSVRITCEPQINKYLFFNSVIIMCNKVLLLMFP